MQNLSIPQLSVLLLENAFYISYFQILVLLHLSQLKIKVHTIFLVKNLNSNQITPFPFSSGIQTQFHKSPATFFFTYFLQSFIYTLYNVQTFVKADLTQVLMLHSSTQTFMHILSCPIPLNMSTTYTAQLSTVTLVEFPACYGCKILFKIAAFQTSS